MKKKSKKPTVRVKEVEKPQIKSGNALSALFTLLGEKSQAARNVDRLNRSIDATGGHLLNVMIERSALRIAEDGTTPKDELKMEREISSHVAHGKAQRAVMHEMQSRLAIIDCLIHTLDPSYEMRAAIEADREAHIGDDMSAMAPILVNRSPVSKKRSVKKEKRHASRR